MVYGLWFMVFPCVACNKFVMSECSMGKQSWWKHRLGSICNSRGKVFSINMKLVQHVTVNHSLQPRHLCHLCAKGFMKKFHLVKHIAYCSKNRLRKKAPREEKDKCRICGKTFCNKTSLTHHLAKVHEAARSPILIATYFSKRWSVFLKCFACSQTFRHRKILKKHMKVHSTGGILLK